MENFTIALNAVVPMFLLIGLGCFARERKMMDDAAVKQANGLCFRLFLSVLMFNNVYTTSTDTEISVGMLVFCVVGCLLGFFAYIPLIKRLEPGAPARGVMLQAMSRTNVILLGLPMAKSIFGAEGSSQISLMIAVMVPVFNVLAVISLEMFRGGRVDPVGMLKKIVKNPLIDGAAVGIFFLLTGWQLPTVLEKAAGNLAAAGTPMALVLLGASLDFRRVGRWNRNLAFCVVGRVILLPALALAAAIPMGFRGVPLLGILLAFGCPVSVSSFTMAAEMGGDAELAGQIVLMSTAVSCITLFLFIFGLKSFGLL